MATPMKHIYFTLPNGKGARGFVTRVCLRASGQAFEDERLTFATWGPRKAGTPLGQLPVLEVGGVAYTQSIPLSAHAAKLAVRWRLCLSARCCRAEGSKPPVSTRLLVAHSCGIPTSGPLPDHAAGAAAGGRVRGHRGRHVEQGARAGLWERHRLRWRGGPRRPLCRRGPSLPAAGICGPESAGALAAAGAGAARGCGRRAAACGWRARRPFRPVSPGASLAGASLLLPLALSLSPPPLPPPALPTCRSCRPAWAMRTLDAYALPC